MKKAANFTSDVSPYKPRQAPGRSSVLPALCRNLIIIAVSIKNGLFNYEDFIFIMSLKKRA
jgi:hypothetical protein